MAIDQALGRIQLDNRGTIEGGVRSYDGSSNQDSIINRGTFIGEAFLGAQDDYFENCGTIDTLKLGGGNDVYWARGEGTGGLVEGGGGFDTLVSGKGDDLFEGGGAPDQFYMRKHGGDDQILDFHGKDVVNLSLLGLSSYREIRHDIHDTADGALLDLSDEFDFTLLLAGVSREDLKANDFLFELRVMTLL